MAARPGLAVCPRCEVPTIRGELDHWGLVDVEPRSIPKRHAAVLAYYKVPVYAVLWRPGKTITGGALGIAERHTTRGEILDLTRWDPVWGPDGGGWLTVTEHRCWRGRSE